MTPATLDKTAAAPAEVAPSLAAAQLWPGDQADYARAFRYQYAITAGREAYPGFTAHMLDAWTLWTGAGLPVARLDDISGAHIGWIIGVAVGEGGLVGPGARLPFARDDGRFFDLLERFIDDLAGRWGMLIVRAGQARFYCDPVGMIGAVYNPHTRRVAASPLLAIDGAVEPNPLFDPADIAAGGRYGLFHTADSRVRRMNPNAWLDLSSFSETRYWPREDVFTALPEAPAALYPMIAARAGHVIASLSRAYPCALPVSGGNDTRLILAFGREHLAQMAQVYTHVNNYAGRIDAAIGAQLAEAAGLTHDVHDHQHAKMRPWQVDRVTDMYRYASGLSGAPPNEYLNGNYRALSDGHLILRGHQTDLLRAVFVFRADPKLWQRYGWQIKRLGLVPPAAFSDAVRDRFLPDFAAWRATLPEVAEACPVDFMFLEVFSSATVG
ncbi:MAG: hypothetical protein AAGG54_12390, partial [Pseudomonadota bacterium]